MPKFEAVQLKDTVGETLMLPDAGDNKVTVVGVDITQTEKEDIAESWQKNSLQDETFQKYVPAPATVFTSEVVVGAPIWLCGLLVVPMKTRYLRAATFAVQGETASFQLL